MSDEILSAERVRELDRDAIYQTAHTKDIRDLCRSHEALRAKVLDLEATIDEVIKQLREMSKTKGAILAELDAGKERPQLAQLRQAIIPEYDQALKKLADK